MGIVWYLNEEIGGGCRLQQGWQSRAVVPAQDHDTGREPSGTRPQCSGPRLPYLKMGICLSWLRVKIRHDVYKVWDT